MPEIVTELTIDARGAEQGAQQFARSLDLATQAQDRMADQARAVDGAISNQTATLTRVAGSTSNAARSFDRLRSSVDPAARAQGAMERATRTLDRAVTQGITTQEEASRVLELVRQKYDTAGREAGQYGQAARRAGTATSGMNRAASQLRNTLAALGLALGVRQVIEYADAWTNAGNRIAAVGQLTAEEAAVVRTAITDIAVETRSNFDATLTLYSRLALGAEELGASQEEMLGIVRTVNEAMTLSGASASEAEGAIRQLGQALGSGALRGDELNSILEQAPILARAIADEMGVTIGQLRDLGAEGVITSQIVFDALQNSSEAIHESFAATETTVGQALTNLETRFIEWVGGANDATGATGALVDIIELLAENIDLVITVAAGLAAAFAFTRIVSGVQSVIAAFAALQGAMAFMMANPFVLALAGIAAVAGAVFFMKGKQEEANVTMERHQEIVASVQDAYQAAAGEVDDWAARIDNLTRTEALANLESRMMELRHAGDDLVGAEIFQSSIDFEALDEVGLRVEDLRSHIVLLREEMRNTGDIDRFTGAIDNLVSQGYLTASGGLDEINAAQRFQSMSAAVDEAQFVLKVFDGQVEATDLVTHGFAQTLDEANVILGNTEAAGADAAGGLDVAGDAARQAAEEFGGLEAAINDAVRAAERAGALTGVRSSLSPSQATEFHAGGLVGRDGVPRSVHPGVFVGAPRLHAGLASDEFPAILQRGEMVIPRSGVSAASGGVVAATAGDFEQLNSALEAAQGMAIDFGFSLIEAFLNAESPLQAFENALANLSRQIMQFARQQFSSGNIGAGVVSTIIGLVVGLISRIIQSRRELKEAKQAWEEMQDEVRDFTDRLAGRGGGELVGALRSVTSEMDKFVKAAEKAEAGTEGLVAALEVFVTRQIRQFIGDFGVMLDALSEGLGSSSPAVEAAQNMVKIGEALRGFVADTAKAVEITGADPKAIAAAEAAAADYALSLLQTAPSLTQVGERLREIQGTAVHLQALLEDLGMSAEEAGLAVSEGVTQALNRLRDDFRDDLTARLNSARDRGHLNDIANLIDEMADLLNDAALLGVGRRDVGRIFALEAQAIVDGADLTGEAFQDLIDLFPGLAGVVTEASDSIEEAMDRINDAAGSILDFLRERLVGADSTLSPSNRLAASRRVFNEQLSLAQSGDVAAQAGIAGFAGDLLDAARDMFASSGAFQEIFDDVTGALFELSSIGGANDPVLAALRQSIAAILGLDDTVAAGTGATTDAVEDVDASTQASLDLLAAVRDLGSGTQAVSNTISESILKLGAVTEDINIALADNYFGPMVGYLEQIAQYTQQMAGVETRELKFPFLAKIFPGLFGDIYKAAGGLIPHRGYEAGGLIGNGIYNQDSVTARLSGGGTVMLAGGEFVTRAPSVNPATFATLDHINRTGRSPGSNDNAGFRDLNRTMQTGANANVIELRRGFGELADRLERLERAVRRSEPGEPQRRPQRARAGVR